MKELFQVAGMFFCSLFFLFCSSCKSKSTVPEKEAITLLNLKRGEVIACGSPEKKFGSVGFETSCPVGIKDDFDLGVALLHSFEYDEAEKVFAKIIDQEPGCAMAYWGVAMSNYHPLWAPPTEAELEKGNKAITIAQAITGKTKKESAYIDAIALFYNDWRVADHATRYRKFEQAMEKMYTSYPEDTEAAIFYALTLTGAADPADKSFAKQRKAVGILRKLYAEQPNHPGIIHYIIHSFDNPELASLALPEARRYASIAPSSAHAQHMPSHIFTRLGLWDEDIQSNIAAGNSARCYAENTGIKGHWDEELHTLDYLVYAYLQKGDNAAAKQQWDYLRTIQQVSPINFKVAYAFAAIPARYTLENRMWKEAATLQLYPQNVDWEKYPWQKAIFHFARVLGAVNIGQPDSAKQDLQNLQSIRTTLLEQKDEYKANQVQIQIKTSEAWIAFKEGKKDEALQLMTAAADLEDKTQKHSVTPGEVLPARELLGDMLLQMKEPCKALAAYEASLKEHANRFNGLYGAGLAADRCGEISKRNFYYTQLIKTANAVNGGRIELQRALSRMKELQL